MLRAMPADAAMSLRASAMLPLSDAAVFPRLILRDLRATLLRQDALSFRAALFYGAMFSLIIFRRR